MRLRLLGDWVQPKMFCLTELVESGMLLPDVIWEVLLKVAQKG